MVRPANYPPRNPGRGWMVFEKNGRKIAVLCLLGVAGFKRVHLKNPFSLLTKLLESIVPETNTILLDFHAVTTAEKATMFAMADGRLSAVIGTHTKGLTADERVLPGAPRSSRMREEQEASNRWLGWTRRSKSGSSRHLCTSIRKKRGHARLQGVIIEIGDDGKATSIERIRETCKAPPPAAKDDDVPQAE